MHEKLFSTSSSTENEYRMEQEQYIKSNDMRSGPRQPAGNKHAMLSKSTGKQGVQSQLELLS